MQRHLMMAGSVLALVIGGAFSTPSPAQDSRPKRIIFLPGPLDKGHPAGTHEYEKTARLLKHCLDRSPLAKELRTEIYPGGWPDDPKALDDADTIVLISNGADRRAEDHPILVGDRAQTLAKQMRRGCGLVAIHWTLFVPENKGGAQFLDWIGGYFDYERGVPQGGRAWYSKIQTVKTQAASRDLAPSRCAASSRSRSARSFTTTCGFRAPDPRFTPILNARIPGETDLQTVAWAVQRKDGGRGFGFSGGHFLDNWQNEHYRTMALNAIVWTAGAEVPKAGVPSDLPADKDAAIRALIVTGHNHPAHDWRTTTKALQETLAQDARFKVTVSEDPDILGRKALHEFDVVLMNYCNWERPGLSDAAQKNFRQYLEKGGGLAIVHFANGAFHFSLPKTANTDWPEWRTRICRRVWDHTPGKSGHDKLGKFTVQIKQPDHAITQGIASFDTVDELYFRQQGEEPITVLATARSQVTGRDEPMAFICDYGKARIFQTVLGHDAAALRTPGTAALIRRGAAWAAGCAPGTAAPADAALVPGKIGHALDARRHYVQMPHRPDYKKPPLTVECWAKLHSKTGFNVIVASEDKASADHWEIYSYASSGVFSAYLPGYAPGEIKSDRDITDDQWHHLAMTFDGHRVRLYVDAQLVKATAVTRTRNGGPNGPLWIGGYPPVNIGCDGLVDEVKISAGVFPIERVPDQAPIADKNTVGLWHLDQLDKTRLADASRLANVGELVPQGAAPPTGPSSSTQLDYEPTDKRLKAVLIDRSPAESYVAIKADTEGRLFVGGREALFVFEPKPGGQYAKQELFRFPPDSWIAGIELRGNDLYVLTAAALYRFAEGRLKRAGLQPERLVWGLPLDLHVSFHCLAWGPEGDLYLNHGDPLLNYGDFSRPDHWGHWTIFTRDGAKVPYTGTGGVFRVRPDGSNFRCVATGLRGPFGLTFDREWNLFTNDNDHESRPDLYTPARLLHVTPHIDFAWPRGWIASKLPDRHDLVEAMNSAPGRGVPVGLACYDEPFLPAAYRHNLLEARWDLRAVLRHPIEPRGASFMATSQPFLAGRGQARPIGVAIGRGGRVFVTVSYMAGNEASPHYASDLVMLTTAADTPEHPFEPYDAPTAAPKKLFAELSQPSLERRQAAHVEILRRGGALLDEATRRLRVVQVDDPAINHLPWLAAASGSPAAAKAIAYDPHLVPDASRLQKLRALAEFPALKAPDSVFVQALRDENALVRLAALTAYFEPSRKLPLAEVILPARSADTYLSQTATRLIARRAAVSDIEGLMKSADGTVRLIAVLAAGCRLTVPLAHSVPSKEVVLSYPKGNAFFHTTIRYGDRPDEHVELHRLGRLGSFTTGEWWKAVTPNAEEQALFALLSGGLKDSAPAVRLQSAYFLSLLRDARTEPEVARVFAGIIKERLASAPRQGVERLWLVGPFPDKGKIMPQAPEQGVVDLTAEYDGAGGKLAWRQEASEKGRIELARTPGHSHYAYFQLQSAVRQSAVLEFLGPWTIRVWHNGTLQIQETAADGSGRSVVLDLQAGSNELLIRVPECYALRLGVRAREPVQPLLPEKLTFAALAERLKAGGKEQVAPEFAAVDWQVEASRGDAKNGRKLFGSLGCVKCHAITSEQKGGGGPSLTDASKRFTVPYLVESILLPSKQIAELFRSTRIATVSGEVLSGLLVGETAETIELLLPATTRRIIRKADVEARMLTAISPMPAGLVRTPAELRDLLAYLLSESPLAP